MREMGKLKKIKLDEYLAKSNGEGLVTHTNKVVENIKLLSNNYNISIKDTSILVQSAILHDIGKVVESFQNHLKTNNKTKFKFTHNIIGWYFVNKFVDTRDVEKVANLVLWHHANDNSCEGLTLKLSDISKELSDSELEVMKEFCKHYEISTHQEESEEEIMDTEFYKIDNLHRSILITADVCASSGESVLELFKQKIIEHSTLNKSFIESNRTNDQLIIQRQILENKTTLIKAPTGFGKSILGLLFTTLQNKSVVWVCPTNIIASSIYNDVIEALKMMGLDMSVELYLTGGKVRKSNKELEEFSSKLIITNIDNFTKPSVSNSFGHRCLMVYDCPVIFDEPHEYDKMECALNASYNNIMSVRHNDIASTTLQLTATPKPPRFIKQGNENITYLPNIDSHYKASHNQKFRIHFHDNTPWNLMTGEFVSFSHTVNEVQDNYKCFSNPKLIAHGRYLDKDKELKKNVVLDNYGKNSPRNELGVFTNQILTTACDYSVKNMFIKCPTIDELFQAMGRLNRFGNMGIAHMHVTLDKTKADETHIGGEDENYLQELFIKDIRSRFEGVEFTLDELYVFYNQFSNINSKLVNSISRQNLTDSRLMLRNVYPKRQRPSKLQKNIANGNKMRHSPVAAGIYISVKRKDIDEWVTLNFNVNKRIGFTKTFSEDKNTIKEQVKILKSKKEFNKYKTITSEIMIKEAIFYDTPYIVFNYQYCDDIGIFKK